MISKIFEAAWASVSTKKNIKNLDRVSNLVFYAQSISVIISGGF